MTEPKKRTPEEIQAALEELALSLHERQHKRVISQDPMESSDLNLKVSSGGSKEWGRDQSRQQVAEAFKEALKSLKSGR